MELFKLLGTIAINGDSAKKEIDETTGKAQKAEGSMTSTFKKIGAAVTTYFAIDKVVEFGKACVESAATVQATNAQFEQVFGGLQNVAQNTINRMGDAFGMLPERLKLPFSRTTSMFKGLGLSTEEAMLQAERSVTMAADAAAFYDVSYEDANNALNSFIKGNYEGGESIGLFANETQMASWASKNLCTDWNTLDEAGKQVIRLQFAEAMQKAAGATGQAARESDGYENKIGNLKAAWEKFLSVIGTPILAGVIPVLTGITTAINRIANETENLQTIFSHNESVQNFGAAVQNCFSGIQEKFNIFVAPLTPKIQGAFDQIRVKFNAVFMPLQKQFTAALSRMSEAVQPVKEAFDRLFQSIRPLIEQFIPIWQQNISRLIDFIGGLLSVIISSIEYIVQILSPFIAAIGNLYSVIVNFIGMVAALINGDWTAAWNFAMQICKNFTDFINNILTGLKNFLWSIFGDMVTAVVTKWNEIYTNTTTWWENIKSTIYNKVTGAVNDVKTGFQNMINGIREKLSYAKETVVSGLQGALDYIASLPGKFLQWGKDIIQQFIDGIKEKIDSGVETIKNFADQLVNKFKEILGIQSPSTVFKDIGKNILQGLINGLNSDSLLSFANNMLDQLKDAFSNGLGDIGKLFSAMGSGAASLFQKLGINFGGGGMVGSNGLIWPSDTGTNALTSYFGYRNDTGGVGSSYHQGVDIGAPDGSPIYASGYGTVSIAGWYGGYGNAVKIGHGGGLETLYGHMSAVAVAPGQTVVPGQVIGYVGSTGNSTGPHIHYSILVDGQQVDPGMFFGFEDGAIVSKPTAGVFAEAGKEALIPLSVPKRRQGLALWRESGKELGAFDDTSSIQGLLQDIKSLLTVIAEKKQIVILDGKIVGELVDERLGAYL